MNSYKKSCCFRIITIVLGVLIWLVGGAVLGFSIYLRTDYWINTYIMASNELSKYQVAIYIFIVTGAVVVLIAMVGIYGAIRPDKCALIVYLVSICLMLVLIVSSGVYGYIYREQIENTIQNSKLLKNVVLQKYGIDQMVTTGIDFMQKELQCCGGQYFTDYKGSVWALDGRFAEERDQKAPLTCCSDYKRYEDISSISYKYCSMYILDFNNPLPQENENIYKTGCSKAIVMFFQKNIDIVAPIAFCIVGLVTLAIVFVSLLLFHLRKVPPQNEDDEVYAMARTQEKSQYPARGGLYSNFYQR